MDGDFLHLVTALDPQWEDLKLNNKSGREGCLRKLRSKLDLLKGQEDVSRDTVDVPKPKRRLLDINESDDLMERARWMSSPGFEILTFATEFLNCCNRYRNEPLGADKNSLDRWKAKKEEYPMLQGWLAVFLEKCFL